MGIHGASLAIWDHTVLPATRHKWVHPAITPANQVGTRLTYPGGMEGWVDLDSLIVARTGIEPMTAWSQVWCPNRYATKPQHGTLRFFTLLYDVSWRSSMCMAVIKLLWTEHFYTLFCCTERIYAVLQMCIVQGVFTQCGEQEEDDFSCGKDWLLCYTGEHTQRAW